MASLREIRRKIKSVRSTQQITRAMKMVAAARMRRAHSAILASRPFAMKMESAIRDLALLEIPAELAALPEVRIHPFFEPRGEERPGLVLITADKGLCGAFNANLLRASIDWMRRQQGRRAAVAVVGKKGRDFLNRLRGSGPEVLTEVVGAFPKVGFAHAELLGKAVIDAYLTGRLTRVAVIYNEFKSIVSQRVVETQLLPIPAPSGKRGTGEGFQFEPGREELLDALLPRFVKAQLYRFLLESQAAELAARMNAMDAASKNAGELIDSLTLGLNRTRQGIITREIAELVGGAEALAS